MRLVPIRAWRLTISHERLRKKQKFLPQNYRIRKEPLHVACGKQADVGKEMLDIKAPPVLTRPEEPLPYGKSPHDWGWPIS